MGADLLYVGTIENYAIAHKILRDSDYSDNLSKDYDDIHHYRLVVGLELDFDEDKYLKFLIKSGLAECSLLFKTRTLEEESKKRILELIEEVRSEDKSISKEV